MTKKDATKEKDAWFRMKYMGYCLANMPVIERSWELSDYYRMIRFQLAKRWRVSMKDPIFDKYTRPEELVVEYFAHRCMEEEAFNDEIRDKLLGKSIDYVDSVDWMAKAEAENKEAIEKIKRQRAEEAQGTENAKIESDIDEEEDGFSFKPEDI